MGIFEAGYFGTETLKVNTLGWFEQYSRYGIHSSAGYFTGKCVAAPILWVFESDI